MTYTSPRYLQKISIQDNGIQDGMTTSLVQITQQI